MTFEYRDEDVLVTDLQLDKRNPRMPEEEFESDDEVIAYLIANADVEELVESIGNSGWLDFEPLIVLDDGSNTVLEGNRRLVALRVIADERVRQMTGLTIPEPLHSGALPESIRVRLVGSRTAAREYIGFKHINGAFKWDALAKAHYAWEWLQEEPALTIRTVSERLGDRHRTVSRMINGYVVLKQGEKSGFDRAEIEKKTFHFSHLYTSLAAPSVRSYLGLPETTVDLLENDPVPQDFSEKLFEFLTWLYGQGSKKAIIRTQFPDLNILVAVLANKSATEILESTSNLEDAYAPLVDRGSRFMSSLFELSNLAKKLLGQTSDYDGNRDAFDTAESLERTVRNLKLAMQAELSDTQERP